MQTQINLYPIKNLFIHSIMSIFNTIYKYNLWGNGSGSGSIPWNNYKYIDFLQNTIKNKKINNIVEIGCGDYRLWKNIKYNGNYIGLDIVDSVILNNNLNYKTEKIAFLNLDISKTILNKDNIDIIIVKDLFIHLSNETILKIIHNIIAMKPKYILITEDTHYFNLQYDILNGMYRPLYIDMYITNGYNLAEVEFYYEITYIIYLCMIAILTLFHKIFLFFLILWIPRKRISLFVNE